MNISFLLVLLPLLASANIWDNLYSGDGVPFELPYNFSMKLVPFDATNGLKYNLVTSIMYNSLSMNMTADTSNGTVLLTQFKFQFSKGHLYAYNEQKGCTVIHNPRMKMDFYYNVEGLLELILVLNSQNMEDTYKKVDVSDLITILGIANCVKNISMYFASDKELSMIGTSLINGTSAGVYVQNMTTEQPLYSEFIPKPDWNCKVMEAIDIDGTDFVIETGANDIDESDEELKYNQKNLPVSTKRYPLSDFMWEYLNPTDILAAKNISDVNVNSQPETFEHLYRSFIDCKNVLPNVTISDEL